MNLQNKFEKRISETDEKSWQKKTLIAFAIFVSLLIVAISFWYWLRSQPMSDKALQPLRKSLELNEKIFGSNYDSNNLAKTYPISKAEKKVRVNGDAGILTEENWQLKVVKKSGDTLRISLSELKKLPKTEIVFDFKCIEGWSQITHWGGVKLKDFLQHYHLENESNMKYVGLETPDKAYYVGIDIASAIHPQTILCYEMNGKTLPQNQGYPLRLIIPVKYGVKHLKRIGTMFFSNVKPHDYWAERGYDYYGGH